jgi:hypothetical protein
MPRATPFEQRTRLSIASQFRQLPLSPEAAESGAVQQPQSDPGNLAGASVNQDRDAAMSAEHVVAASPDGSKHAVQLHGADVADVTTNFALSWQDLLTVGVVTLAIISPWIRCETGPHFC